MTDLPILILTGIAAAGTAVLATVAVMKTRSKQTAQQDAKGLDARCVAALKQMRIDRQTHKVHATLGITPTEHDPYTREILDELVRRGQMRYRHEIDLYEQLPS